MKLVEIIQYIRITIAVIFDVLYASKKIVYEMGEIGYKQFKINIESRIFYFHPYRLI